MRFLGFPIEIKIRNKNQIETINPVCYIVELMSVHNMSAFMDRLELLMFQFTWELQSLFRRPAFFPWVQSSCFTGLVARFL